MFSTVQILEVSVSLFVIRTANKTQQQVLTTFNNYKPICNGLGYEKLERKGLKTSHIHVWIKFLNSYKNPELNSVKTMTVYWNLHYTNFIKYQNRPYFTHQDYGKYETQGNCSLWQRFVERGKSLRQINCNIFSAVWWNLLFPWATWTKGGKRFITEIVHNGHRTALNHNDGKGLETFSISSSHATIKMKKG